MVVHPQSRDNANRKNPKPKAIGPIRNHGLEIMASIHAFMCCFRGCLGIVLNACRLFSQNEKFGDDGLGAVAKFLPYCLFAWG